MLARGGKVGYALRCGVLLLCLGFVTGQTLAQEHLHLDAHDGAGCVVCASGDSTPLGQVGLHASGPSYVNTETTQSVAPRAPITRHVASYASRAPPANS